jgi:ribosomal protein S12 methylthiotransferase
VTEILNAREKALEMGSPLPKRSYIDQPAFIHTEKDPRVHTGPLYSAFLKLSEGCARRCAFCIIPVLRGGIVRSRTMESLVEEARGLAARGVRELNLVAQDLTHYGIDGKFKDRLETLLPELCRIEGIEWIRLHYVYPDQFSDELIEIIAREPKIVKYLDMPIQHTNDRVLRSMNRRLTKARLFSLIEKLRERIPELVFRTSVIVGFPGETEAEFEEMASDMEKLALDYVGVFRFSKEEGTKAGEMEGQIHAATKRKRAKKLQSILEAQSKSKNEKYVGKKMTILLEGTSDESELLLQGRMPTQAAEIDGRVLVNDVSWLGFEASELRPGDLIEVEVVEAMPHDVVAKAIRIVSKGMTLAQATRGGLKTIIPMERPDARAAAIAH